MRYSINWLDAAMGFPRGSVLMRAATSAVWALLPLTGQAQMLEEVLVTAQKRAQSLQDVPISVSAVSGEKLERAGILDFADLSAYVPNFQKADTALGPVLLIRGIGSGVNQSFEQSVVQYADDVALGRAPLARMPFMDFERVEVLRGPQNVLFGKNSIGGALSITTAEPTEAFEGRVSAEYEHDYNQQLYTGVLSGPLTGALAGRLAVRSYSDAGYYDNLTSGNQEPGRDEFSIRGKLRWDFNDAITSTLKAEHAAIEANGTPSEVFLNMPSGTGPLSFLFSGLTYPEIGELLGELTGEDVGSEDGVFNFRRSTNVEESSEIAATNITLRLEGKLGAIDVTGVTAWLEYDTDELCDCDQLGLDVLSITQSEDYQQFSQELRFTSPVGGAFDWIGGAFYQYSDLAFDSFSLVDDNNVLTALGVLGDSLGPAGAELTAIGLGANSQTGRAYDSESEIFAVFAQATWHLSAHARMTIGARYTYEEKTASRVIDSRNTATDDFDLEQSIVVNQLLGIDLQTLGELSATQALGPEYPKGFFSTHNLDQTNSEDAFTPSLVLEWDASDSAMVYGSVASGYKSGGFDARGNREGDFFYDNETVVTYELGAKTRLFDNRAELNAAAFYTDYRDLQVSQFDGEAGFFVGNAPKAVTQGVELDGRVQLSEGLSATLSMAYLDFEFKEYEGSCSRPEFIETGVRQCDYQGRRNIFTPEWSGSLGLAYTRMIASGYSLYAGLDVSYVDEQFVEVTLYEPLQQDAYTRVNAQLGLESDRWSILLIGRNLTDEDITSYISEVTLSGGNPFYAPSYAGFYERPQTVALQFNYWFD